MNIPIRTEEGRKIRRAFVAEPGHVLISADYSQIELRLLAHIGDIPQLKRAFVDGLDIHAMTASEMFGVPVEGMPSETRRRAKAINFGIIYGISAFGLANQLAIPQDEAGAYIRTYFERFPGIRAYMDQAKQMVRTQGYVSTIFGRKVHVPAAKGRTPAERAFGDRAAINAPIQGSAADVIRRAMVRMPAALAAEGLRARMLLQVHDELVFEAPEAEAEAVIAVAKRVMSRAAEPVVALSVPLVVEARAAGNWDDAHCGGGPAIPLPLPEKEGSADARQHPDQDHHQGDGGENQAGAGTGAEKGLAAGLLRAGGLLLGAGLGLKLLAGALVAREIDDVGVVVVVRRSFGVARHAKALTLKVRARSDRRTVARGGGTLSRVLST
jgi:hypothetical protein